MKKGDKVKLVFDGIGTFYDGILEDYNWAEKAGLIVGYEYDVESVEDGDIRIVGHSFIHPSSKFVLVEPIKEVNLEQILKSYLTVETMKANKPDYTFNMVLSAMKEACRQTLELAAENAEVVEFYDAVDTEPKWKHIVERNSITNTINQVK